METSIAVGSSSSKIKKYLMVAFDQSPCILQLCILLSENIGRFVKYDVYKI